MIKKAFETTEKKTYAALIYGQTGVGKSTLACSADNSVVIDFDNGLDRVPILHRRDYTAGGSWEQMVADTREAAMTYDTIIVDTVGKMIELIESDIIANNPQLRDKKGGLSLKGFAMRKNMFSSYIKDCKTAGVNLIFVAQETETDEDGRKIRRPAIGSDKMATELLQDLDLAGYVHVVNGRRVIEWGTVDYAWTKNSCGLPQSMQLPDLAKEPNELMVRVAEQFKSYQTAKVETSQRYVAMKEQIDERLEKVQSCEELTEAMRELAELPDILGSRTYAKQAVKDMAASLSCKWDKGQGAFVAK